MNISSILDQSIMSYFNKYDEEFYLKLKNAYTNKDMIKLSNIISNTENGEDVQKCIN